MIALDDLVAFLDSYMGGSEAVARIDPQMANGLQVRGRERVGTIVTGVSASVRFFEEAAALGADALVVHHSLNMPAGVHFDHIFSHRLRVLFERGLSLIGYHYLLDSHPEVGNNAQIVKQLGATLTERYTSDGWGWVGEFDPPVGRDDLLRAQRPAVWASGGAVSIWPGAGQHDGRYQRERRTSVVPRWSG